MDNKMKKEEDEKAVSPTREEEQPIKQLAKEQSYMLRGFLKHKGYRLDTTISEKKFTKEYNQYKQMEAFKK